uniref:hypothetical protein n=1 Tax=Sphingomonas panni TaxID=237612 RepID=UPI0037045AC1
MPPLRIGMAGRKQDDPARHIVDAGVSLARFDGEAIVGCLAIDMQDADPFAAQVAFGIEVVEMREVGA